MALSQQEMEKWGEVADVLLEIVRGGFVGIGGFSTARVDGEAGVYGVAAHGGDRFARQTAPRFRFPANLVYTWSDARMRELLAADIKQRAKLYDAFRLNVGWNLLEAAKRPDVDLNEGCQAAEVPIVITLDRFGR